MTCYKNLKEEFTKLLMLPLQGFRRSRISSFMLGLCLRLLHLVISTVHMVLFIANTLESYLISTVLSGRYKVLQLNKLRYLAIVVDSEEALLTSRIIKLLQWLSAIGVTHVSLYDMEGVLKQNKEMLLKNLTNTKPWEEADIKANNLNHGKMTLEFLSISDGKDGAAKAASFLFSKYLKASSFDGNQIEPVFTEADMDSALREVGCGGPDPNLLLIYGPARCHLGFPAWRMRYTEIVHMGKLKSMKHGAIIKAIHKLTKVHQNYGS